MSRFRKLSQSCSVRSIVIPYLTGPLVKSAEQQIHQLARQKDLIEMAGLNVQSDHIHTILSVPPKYSISGLMGFLKGKMALNLFHRFERLSKRYWGRHLWSRGYCMSTAGLDEDQIRKYVRWQNHKDRQAEPLGLWS